MRGRIEKAVFRGTKERREEIKAAGRENSGVEGGEIDGARREREKRGRGMKCECKKTTYIGRDPIGTHKHT